MRAEHYFIVFLTVLLASVINAVGRKVQTVKAPPSTTPAVPEEPRTADEYINRKYGV